LNKLWRLINSLQIILLLPLMNIKFQGNAELVYNFIDTNSNMYFQCNNDATSDDTGKESFFNYDNEEPYGDSFEA
jgi:hypothetical protein